MDPSLFILVLLLLIILHRSPLSSAAESPMMLPSLACSDELVAFSSCLPFVGASPNNRTEFPAPQCCDDISAAFSNGTAVCLCYFILQPDILGFPLNSSQLLSLTSFCPRNDPNSTANFSLHKLCSDSAALPPLRSITGTNKPKPHNNTVARSPPPQESRDGPSTELPADELPIQATSSGHKIYWLHWTLLGLLVLHIHFSTTNKYLRCFDFHDCIDWL